VAWLDSAAAAERFGSSPFIRRAWPEALRERTLPFFAIQEEIDRSRGVRVGKPLHPAERIRRLDETLRDTTLRTLPLWWLAVDSDQTDAVARRLAANASPDPFAFQLGAMALAERDFAAAAELFDRAAGNRRTLRILPYVRVYARRMAGQREAARALAESLFGAEGATPEDRAFLSWLEAAVPIES